ncbi:hypothetical protein EV356DRAFT_435485, partial [Viridothelium virens]
SYNKVVEWDWENGQCSQAQQPYNGPMSPLDEEVSMHFQGPMYLRQFAVYTPSASTESGKSKRQLTHLHGHGHRAFHDMKKERKIQERAVGDIVYATIDGQLVSWINSYSGPPAPATATGGREPVAMSPASIAAPAYTADTTMALAPAAPLPAAAPPPVAAHPPPAAPPPAAAPPAAAPPAADPPPAAPSSIGSGAWSQIAYLNTKQAKSHSFGISFLNKLGVLDAFGLTLAYAAADGTATVALQNETPESNYYIPSNSEIVMMSDKKCDASDCMGALRTPGMSFHGWPGAEKAFFIEFSMPDDGITTPPNGNKPAIWMLNAQIPRSVQFGNAECSPWSTGGGELDVFEVLESGNPNATVTLHSNINGGGNAIFERPTDKNSPIKFAVVFYDNGAHMQILDESF